MNYIQKAIDLLEVELKMKGTPYEGLLELYGLLIFTQGENCTNEHIHDAWSIWQNRTDPKHRSLKPFEDLTFEVQELDGEYRDAVIRVANQLL